MRKFIDWWNKKPNSEGNGETQEERYSHKDEEFYYETTLNLDLKRLSNLFKSEFPLSTVERLCILKGNSLISFKTRDISMELVREIVPLESLIIVDKRRGMRMDWDSYSRMYDETIQWEASYEEYNEVYKPHHSEYVENIIKPLLEQVETNYENKLYFYIFTKYEDSIHIVYNALKDAKEQSGEISDELFQKSTVIIEKLKAAMDKKTGEIDHIEKLQQEAVSKSLIDRLNNEIEFIDNYIEVN